MEEMEGQRWKHKDLLSHFPRFSSASLFKGVMQMDQSIDVQVVSSGMYYQITYEISGVCHTWVSQVIKLFVAI